MEQPPSETNSKRLRVPKHGISVARPAAAGLLVALLSASTAIAQPGCDDWQAEFVSVQGSVEIASDTGAEWSAVRQGDHACLGNVVRVIEYSRAALRLPDRSVLRLNQNTQLQLSQTEAETKFWVRLIRGIIHVISRDPRQLQFDTPYVNAGLEGTEFTLEVADGRTEVNVLEGVVALTNDSSRLDLAAGQQGSATAAGTLAAREAADPLAPVRWTPYSAPILIRPIPDAGALPGAREQADPDFYTGRAAARLRIGALDAARGDISTAESLAGADRDETGALRTMLALAAGEKDRARADAAALRNADPESAAAWLALSHASQADFDFESALGAAERASAFAPGSAIVLARLSELHLALGDFRRASEAAEAAEVADPSLGHAHMMLGFAALAEGDARSAAAAFERAAALEQASPLPRLGRGLALIRQGRLDAGRDQLEIAVALDPTNATIRSYMAKIYATAHRQDLATSQFDLATEIDPTDPTSYLYRAINSRRENRPVEALQALDRATELNDSQPIFRSELRIDEDLAVRSAGLGRLYIDLGFDELALRAAARANTADRVDHTAHRLLADAYSRQPRHEIARANEQFIARLTEPLNVNPLPPQLGELNRFLLSALGTGELASRDFGALVPTDGLKLQGSVLSASNATEGYDVEIAGNRGALAYGFGHFDFTTDGFRANNDLSQQVSNAFLQIRPGYDSSVLAEYRRSSADQGQLRLLYDPLDFNPDVRQSEDVESLRVGFRQSLSDSGTLLGAVIFEDQTGQASSGAAFESTAARDGGSMELQYVRQFDRWQSTSGLYRLDHDETFTESILLPTPFPPFQVSLTEEERTNAVETSLYSYVDLEVDERWTTTFGFSADEVESGATRVSQLSPKLGFTFAPGPATTVRGTALRTIQGPHVSRRNLQPRLEPTQVAGFNQLFLAPEGENGWRYGLGVDHRFSDDLAGGIEFSTRDLESQTIIQFPDGSSVVDMTLRDERTDRAYLYWTPGDRVSLSVEYFSENTDVAGASLVDGFAELETRRLPVEVNYFSNGRLYAGARMTFLRQRGQFVPMGFNAAPDVEPGGDDFIVIDISLGYRLPGNRGTLTLLLNNALDETFRFQDVDPENPSILPGRMLGMRISFAY